MHNKFGMPIIKAEWLLTRSCQLHCSYCEIAHKPIKELTIGQKKQIATKLKEMNVFPVIYGGEVTMAQNFEELLAHLQSLNMHYALISHGMVDLMKLEKWATKFKIPNWSVSVDTLRFDHPTMDEDTIRKARSGLATLKFTEGMIPDRVTCTTITKYNIEEIPDIVEAMSDMGVYTILSLVNQYKPGFRYSAPASNQMLPTQKQLEKLVQTLKQMRQQTRFITKTQPLLESDQHLIREGFRLVNRCYRYEGENKTVSKLAVYEKEVPKYLFHDPIEVWDLALQYGIKADWKCSRLSKFTIDADGSLGCCVDWKGKSYGQVNFLDLTEDNIQEIEEKFLDDISDCHSSTGGCAWFPSMLTENFQLQGEKGLEMIRHGH
jgi:MoaA/NifB/PqqE/SkfB family radical SAM enzyme